MSHSKNVRGKSNLLVINWPSPIHQAVGRVGTYTVMSFFVNSAMLTFIATAIRSYYVKTRLPVAIYLQGFTSV